MSFDNRDRRVGKVQWRESEAVPLDLPRKNLYRDLLLTVEGQITISTPGTPALKAGGMGSALKMIKRVTVMANGRDTIKSISADAIAAKNMFLFGSKPKLTEVGLTADVHSFGGTILLPYGIPRAIREIDTLLPSGKLATLTLEITYGAKGDMFSTPPSAYTVDKVDVEVDLDESIRLDAKEEPFSSYKELFIEKDITAVNPEFQILLPIGNKFRGFLIESESDGNMVDTIVNKVVIKSGTDVYRSKRWKVIQGENTIKFNLKDQSFVGYAYVDFCPEGRMVDARDATRLSTLEMLLDVAHPGTVDKVRIYPCEIIPPMPV